MNKDFRYSRLKIIHKDKDGNDIEKEISFDKTVEQHQAISAVRGQVKNAKYLSAEHFCSCKYRKYRDKVLLYIMKKMINDYQEKAEEYIKKKKIAEEEDYDEF